MRELFREFRIARERTLDEHDERVTLAWCVAVLNNQKKIPPLRTLLARQTATPQSPAEQRAVMRSIADHLGVKLLSRKLKKSTPTEGPWPNRPS